MTDLNSAYGILNRCNDLDVILEPLDQRILMHARRWQLVGVFLRCTVCGEAQRASQSGAAFPHFAGCAAGSNGEDHPWHQLADILRDLPVLFEHGGLLHDD